MIPGRHMSTVLGLISFLPPTCRILFKVHVHSVERFFLFVRKSRNSYDLSVEDILVFLSVTRPLAGWEWPLTLTFVGSVSFEPRWLWRGAVGNFSSSPRETVVSIYKRPPVLWRSIISFGWIRISFCGDFGWFGGARRSVSWRSSRCDELAPNRSGWLYAMIGWTHTGQLSGTRGCHYWVF